MQLVKLITPKRIKTLHCFFLTILVLVLSTVQPVSAQDNSPYSRYGIGDIVPPTNIINRAMGGISAAYTDYLSINFNNPASYSYFQTVKEAKSNKLLYGRALLDVGVNVENRSLRENNIAKKFTASNALFSYVQIGVPLKKDWGLSFGLRPISRISYNILKNQRLVDPNTGLSIDTAQTNYTGNGGSYLASVGTGFSVFSSDKMYRKGKDSMMMQTKLSIGINGGYYFGGEDYSTKRSFLNDSVAYYQSNYETKTSFGNLYFNGGVQFQLPLQPKLMMTLGAYGQLGQKIDARQDLLRETFTYDDTRGNLRLDSVLDRKDVKGVIEIPASFTYGFAVQKFAVQNKESGWLIGVDYTSQNWSQYRYFGAQDSVTNSWQVKVGAQLSPVPKKSYLSNVSYRFGFYLGRDYVKVQNELPVLGGTFGMGLPMRISRQAPNQLTVINLAFEYGKRGNKDNLLRESNFRISLGFSLSDFWFAKRKYD